MRLLIATGLYPPEIGGPATYAKLFEERLPQRGIEVTVVPFKLVRHLPRGIRHLAYLWKLVAAARGADVMLVQDTVSTGVPAAIAAMLTRKKLIVRVPGDYAWEQGVQQFRVKENLDEFQKHVYGPRVSLMRALQRFTVRHADRIIAPSHYLARIVSGWVPLHRSPDVVYNGVDVGAVPTGVLREYDLIVSSGRLVPWKGFDALIDVVARQPKWRLVILGDGPERAKLEEKIRAAKAEERIQIPGQVANKIAYEWFARASVFVLNSTYEGLSHTLIEALAAGTPVVATNVGGNPEVIRDEASGILIPTKNAAALERAIALIFQDDAMRATLEAGGRERAMYFSIDTTIEQTVKILNDPKNIKDGPL